MVFRFRYHLQYMLYWKAQDKDVGIIYYIKCIKTNACLNTKTFQHISKDLYSLCIFNKKPTKQYKPRRQLRGRGLFKMSSHLNNCYLVKLSTKGEGIEKCPKFCQRGLYTPLCILSLLGSNIFNDRFRGSLKFFTQGILSPVQQKKLEFRGQKAI